MRARSTGGGIAALARSIGLALAFAGSGANAAVEPTWRDTSMVEDAESDTRRDPAAKAHLESLDARHSPTRDSTVVADVFDVPRDAKAAHRAHGGDRVAAARAFLHAHAARYGLSARAIDALALVADDHGPERA